MADDFRVTATATYHRAFVNLTPSALLAHSRTEAGRRAIRYASTSVIGVGLTQALLLLFQAPMGIPPVQANLLAVSIVAIPAFMLNKYWVWGKRGRAHMRREVLPFWLFTVAGWALSTLCVYLVVDATKTAANPHGNKLAVQLANIAGFGVLWILKYVFLDKIMFGAHHHTPYDEDIEREEAALDVSPS